MYVCPTTQCGRSSHTPEQSTQSCAGTYTPTTRSWQARRRASTSWMALRGPECIGAGSRARRLSPSMHSASIGTYPEWRTASSLSSSSRRSPLASRCFRRSWVDGSTPPTSKSRSAAERSSTTSARRLKGLRRSGMLAWCRRGLRSSWSIPSGQRDCHSKCFGGWLGSLRPSCSSPSCTSPSAVSSCQQCRRAAILSVQRSSDFVSPAVSVGGCRGAGLASRYAVGPDVAADGDAGDPEQPGGRPHRESL